MVGRQIPVDAGAAQAGRVSSPERRKGTGFELEIVNFLRTHGFPMAGRAYGAGRPDDVGDINGVAGWCLEAKNHKSLDLAGWCSEAAAESANARTSWWAVIAKRRNRPVSDAYVVMPLEQFARLLAGRAARTSQEPVVFDFTKGEVRGTVA
jgi:hypothetical protein